MEIRINWPSDNKIKTKGGTLLCEALKNNTTLTKLVLSDNNEITKTYEEKKEEKHDNNLNKKPYQI